MLTVNSIIEWIGDEEESRFERILWINQAGDQVIVYPIDEQNGFPKVTEAERIESAFENELAIKRTQDPFLRLDLPDITTAYKAYEKRDFYWKLIENLVADEPDIYDPKLRGIMIKEIQEKWNVQYKDVLRYLRRYWKGGMTKNALFSEEKNKGGKGKTRNIVTDLKKSQSKYNDRQGKRGRRSNIEVSHGIHGLNVTPEAVKIFKLAYDKFYIQEKLPLIKTYEKMLRKYFNVGYEVNNDEKTPVLPPLSQRYTFREFTYWVRKDEIIKKTLMRKDGMKNFNTKHRAVLDDVSKMADGPGKLYQVDSTIADILLVSELDPRIIIGSPVLYLVSDTFSRKIAGLYVGLEGPNWEGYAMALANAFENKVDYCKRYDIEITEDTWNASFIPDQIITDRGPEFIGNYSSMLVNAFDMHTSHTAPFRPDWKPVVERDFGFLNEEVIHWLAGSTQGRRRERGDQKPAKNAILTLNDFTAILIDTILTFNNSHFIDEYPLTKGMIKDGVLPVPDQLWRWGLAESGRLREADPRLAKLNLLPQATASVQREGIKFKNLYYSCPRAISEGWFELSHHRGSWSIKISYDRRWTDVIYFIDEEGQPITCKLLPRSEKFKGLRFEEVEEYFAQKKIQKKLHDEVQATTKRDERIENITKRAKVRKDNALKNNPMSKTQREKTSREERQNEKERNRFEEVFDLREEKSTMSGKPLHPTQREWKPQVSKEKNALEILRKKRGKA
ncbi:Mu transposase C-terminal domain-containing protein [Paenibacillus sp. FSL R5-0914]|uniref:Mu transposase C-terminal domain-containing protein n=1 Tax=Paenibacillus sp. FSL R5-0914 TaxID=2921665 RepID=UPI0030FA42A8